MKMIRTIPTVKYEIKQLHVIKINMFETDDIIATVSVIDSDNHQTFEDVRICSTTLEELKADIFSSLRIKDEETYGKI
jgi:hypothetical protein